MPSLTVTTTQVVELVRQLPPEQRRAVLLTLAEDAQARRAERMAAAEGRLRALAAERGLVWDELDEDSREAFVDDLLHERH
jgi:hypothetical protein